MFLLVFLYQPQFFFVSFGTVFELFCGESFETLETFLAILLPIKSPVGSAAFLLRRFNYVYDKFLSMIKRYLTVFTAKDFFLIFFAKEKNP